MRYRRTAWLTTALIIAVCAPVAQGALKSKKSRIYDCPARIKKGIEKYERGRYSDVKTILDEVKFQCSGHSMIDTVLYYLGMSLMRSDKGLEAQTEFEQLIQNYPNSPFKEQANFRVGQCAYLQSNPYDRDQTQTREAIRKLDDFAALYPQSPYTDSARVYLDKCYDKLAHKDFSTARFYHRIEQYDAAVVYFKAIIGDYPGSAYVAESKLFLADALYRLNRDAEAADVVADILAGQYDESIKRKAANLQQRYHRKS